MLAAMCRQAASLLAQELESKWLKGYSSLHTRSKILIHKLMNILIIYEWIDLEQKLRYIVLRLNPAVELFARDGQNCARLNTKEGLQEAFIIKTQKQ